MEGGKVSHFQWITGNVWFSSAQQPNRKIITNVSFWSQDVDSLFLLIFLFYVFVRLFCVFAGRQRECCSARPWVALNSLSTSANPSAHGVAMDPAFGSGSFLLINVKRPLHVIDVRRTHTQSWKAPVRTLSYKPPLASMFWWAHPTRRSSSKHCRCSANRFMWASPSTALH